MSRGCVIIVDPYSSGATLAEALRARDTNCIAVESSPELSPLMKSGFKPRHFSTVISHHDDREATLQTVRGHQPTHVIAGFESGVELAEWLAQQLALPTNAANQSRARRDKFLMSEAARKHGLRTAQQFRSSEIDEILAWIHDSLPWPVIVKPLSSVASDDVILCDNAAQVRQAVDTILSKSNILGYRNKAVLVQEFLSGVEYAVDTVCFAGHKKFTAIWEYHRPADLPHFVCYDAMTLLPYAGNRQDALRDYVSEVLESLGVEFGPTHCELMWVDGEPVLIELGARMSAGINSELSRICGGICQLDETANIIQAPERFLSTLEVEPKLEKRAVNVFLMPHHPGRLVRVRGLEQIEQLATLHSMSVGARPGDMLQRVAGLVTLVHEDIEALERDVRTIRALEHEGMFEIQQGSSF